MKKMLLVTAIVIAAVVNANAMSYERARSEALFLTDKMAYELDLTDYQYDAVYEINLDYFNGLIGTTDILGINWNRRANELGYVLTSWQYKLFLESEYFYRPVVIRKSALYFTIYDRYARDRFFRPNPPRVYASYRVGTRRYHEKPHNNMHFADKRHRDGAHKIGDKPKGNHNNGHHGNVADNHNHGNNPAKPSGNHNTGNVNGANKPGNKNTGNHNPGNVNKTPKVGDKPSGNHNSGNVNATTKPANRNTGSHGTAKATNGNTTRSTHTVAPERRSSSNATSSAARRSSNTAGSSTGRRSR
ncbi:MAG: hypothetical protein J5801_00880 [Bacteroidales bacterium]|nr:hypothetical protein [Bacteroidales bacterium]